MKFFKGETKPCVINEPREDYSLYDYTSGHWGHAISYFDCVSEDPEHYRVIAHGSGLPPSNKERDKSQLVLNSFWRIREGDLIQIKTKEDGTLVDCLVLDIEYKRDPKDMFEALVEPYEKGSRT